MRREPCLPHKLRGCLNLSLPHKRRLGSSRSLFTVTEHASKIQEKHHCSESSCSWMSSSCPKNSNSESSSNYRRRCSWPSEYIPLPRPSPDSPTSPLVGAGTDDPVSPETAGRSLPNSRSNNTTGLTSPVIPPDPPPILRSKRLLFNSEGPPKLTCRSARRILADSASQTPLIASPCSALNPASVSSDPSLSACTPWKAALSKT